MRVVANIADASIVNVEKTPDIGETRTINGKFVLPIPEMVALEVTSDSYVLPVDGGDVTSLAMGALLTQYPMYEHVMFNPFLSATDMAAMDLTATFTPTGDITRAVVGRGAGPLPTGIMPNMVGVLANNTRVAPNRPGVLISDTIDISAVTSGAGADEFLVWWKLFEFSTSDDVSSDYGATDGENSPAVRSITEVDSEPAGFEVWISNDDGATYTQVYRDTPTDMGVFGTDVRVAFRNTGSSIRYIASFAILF